MRNPLLYIYISFRSKSCVSIYPLIKFDIVICEGFLCVNRYYIYIYIYIYIQGVSG